MTRVFAAADVGSNTAHLLVAATDGELVMRIDNYNEWIPLGEVVARQGLIPKETQQQLVLALKEIKRTATVENAERLYVFATEGMRAASNHDAVLKKIQEQCGIKVEIVSPAREADLSLRGVLLDTRHLGIDTVFEVGGGSVQIGRVEKNVLADQESLPLGTGRVIAEAGLRNPCPAYALNAAMNYIDSKLVDSRVTVKGHVAVASGGVGRGLWRALHPDGEKTLSMEEMDYIVWTTSRLPIDRIISRFNVKQRRAGTLLPGALVYRALMRRFALTELIISEFGIREGAILEMAVGKG